MVMTMPIPDEILNLTDVELMQHICFFLGGIFYMKIAEWMVTACKWFYGWLNSMFKEN